MASYPDLVYLDRGMSQMEAMVLKWINYAELELINLFCPILELLHQQGGMAPEKATIEKDRRWLLILHRQFLNDRQNF